MYIRIRKVDAANGDGDAMITVSKKMKIQEVRCLIQEKLQVEPHMQKLFYKGKLLVDDHTLVDYNVQLNDVLQLIIKTHILTEKQVETTAAVKKDDIPTIDLIKAESLYYKVGDLIDYRDMSKQWLEGAIVDILKGKANEATTDEKYLIFKIKLEGNENCLPFDAEFDDIRPRSYHLLGTSDLSENMIVMVNYNIDTPNMLGYWYDFEISFSSRKLLKGLYSQVFCC